jgi:putative ABC transport system ATP-binding protein
MTPLIQLTDVSKLYDGGALRIALEGVTLQIDAGEFTAIMGPSGSGKSTLLNLVAGIDRPTQGQVVVDGITLGQQSEAQLARYRRDRIGFIFQFFNLLNNLTVRENIAIPAELSSTKTSDIERRVRELLEQLGLAGKAKEFPGRLSGGERQRVAIARALVNRPVLLLADEPTGALDTHNGEQVMEQLAELNRAGQTILLVTHDPKLAAAYANRVITLRDGRVVEDVRLASSSSLPPGNLVKLRIEEAAQ